MDPARVSYFRNFVFGVEDSLVSTVGLLSGVAIAGIAREQILLTGIVLIFVEAISMAAGSFLAEASAEEFETRREDESPRSRLAALVMFVSYFISGFIPLAPYVFFTPVVALPTSILASLVALAILGIVGARLSGVKVFRNAGRMVLIGGLAIAVGAGVGMWLG